MRANPQDMHALIEVYEADIATCILQHNRFEAGRVCLEADISQEQMTQLEKTKKEIG